MHRRQFCSTLAALGVGTAAIGSVQADTGDSHFSGVVSTKDHFEIVDEEAQRVDGIPETAYDIEGAIPGYTTEDDADELVLFVHNYHVDPCSDCVDSQDDEGIDTGPTEARETFEMATESLAALGVDAPLVGYTWDADYTWDDDWGWTFWDESVWIAKQNALKLAAFLEEFDRRAPETTLRLIGHGLGCRIVLDAIAHLDESDDWSGTIDTLSMLGPAVHDFTMRADHDGETTVYGGPVERNVAQADNFYRMFDEELQIDYRIAEGTGALGAMGADGDTPMNYYEERVDNVVLHMRFFYLEADGGCADAVVDRWE